MRQSLLKAASCRSFLFALFALASFGLFAQPANDTCGDAIPLVCNAPALTGQTTVDATEAPSPSGCASSFGVWYSVTGTGDDFTVTAANPSFDHEIEVVSVPEGAGCEGPFTRVVCRDGSIGTETIEFSSEEGVQYYVYIGHFSTTSATTGTFDIELTCEAPPMTPANDDCANAAVVLQDGSLAAGTQVGATPSGTQTACTGTEDDDVWFSFVATDTAVLVSLLNVEGTTTDLVHAVYDACDAEAALNCSDPNTSRVDGLTVGDTYFIQVYTWSSFAQEVTFDLQLMDTAPPANDSCANAQVVTNGETVNGSTVAATFDDAPFCGTSEGTGGGVWFSYTPDITGQTTIDLCESGFDTKVRVYTGSCDDLVCVDGNDDGCGTRSSVRFAGEAGTEYLVLVHGFNAASGSFVANFSTILPPPNDSCTAGIELVVDTTVPGTTNGASVNGVPTCGGFAEGSGGTVWYSFTTAIAGELTVNTCEDSEFDTRLAVFTGSCAELSCAGGNDDFCGLQSQVTTVEVGPGTEFFVAVTGFNAAAGNFNITTSFDTCISNFACVTDTLIALDDNGMIALDSLFAFRLLAADVNICTGDSLALDEGLPEAFGCDDIGVQEVSITYFPGMGQPSPQTTCDVNVTVADTTPPVITTIPFVTVQVVDNNATVTLDDILESVLDNCSSEADLSITTTSLSFSCDDEGDAVVTISATDAAGNIASTDVEIFLIPESANAACFNEVNLTLNDDCQGLVIPSMVLSGQTNCLDDDLIRIVVQDSDPSNGPIVDGCGRFVYNVMAPTVGGDVTGFNAEDWVIASDESGDQIARSRITPDSLGLLTLGGTTTTADFEISATYMFTTVGTASFDYAYNGIDSTLGGTFFDDALIVYDFDGNVVETVLDSDMPSQGSSSISVFPGYTLSVTVMDDGFRPILNGGSPDQFSVLALTNFRVQSLVVADFSFTGCWGYLNAEDKTPPAVVTTPDGPTLLCVDFESGANDLTSLPATVDRCYRVYSNDASALAATNDPATMGGQTVRGTMAPALRARLLAGGSAPLVPTFTDGCTEQIEVCVLDAITFGDDPSCDDIVVTRTFTATEVATCPSASGETNPSVTASFDITFVRPTLANLSGENIEAEVNIAQCGVLNPTRADYPAPRSADFPFLEINGSTFNLSAGQAVCNIGVTFSDGAPIQTCDFTYKFVRTYTVIDWCAPDDIRTFTQVVKVGDETPPTLVGPNVPTDADGRLIYGTNIGNQCAAVIRLDDVSVIDACSGTNVSISAEIYPGGDLTGTPIGAFNVVPGGSPDLSTAIPEGRHLLRYIFKDVCGNSDIADFPIIVLDQTPPTAICEDGLNISIGGSSNNGFAVLTAEDLDAGSYDDCTGITRSIAFVNENDLPVDARGRRISDAQFAAQTEITVTCDELGTQRVSLRVEDGLGNVNYCWLDILVEDKLAPTCVAPGPTSITCDIYNQTLPADISTLNTPEGLAQLDGLFGTAAGVDNCGTTITQTVSGDINSCGVGSIVRNFLSTDGAGFTNTNNCQQFIEVLGVHDYRITLPVDVSFDCGEDPSFMEVSAEEFGCDLITTTRDVDTLRTQLAGDECFKLRITYDIVNWCEYNSLGEPYVIRRDAFGAVNRRRQAREGDNLESDVVYVNVIPNGDGDDDDVAFVTLNTDRNINTGSNQRDFVLGDNDDDDDDDDDSYGSSDSRGFFRYTQFVRIYDEVAPEITFTAPADCFVGDDANCAAAVEINFAANDACSAASVTVELDPFYDAATGFQADAATAAALGVSVDNDGEGNFTVTASGVPAGTHALRVNASDGCGNFDTQIIVFCVEANRTPTPICIQTLTVVLADDGNGGGIAAIWGSDFIASPIIDCVGDEVTKYSLYRADDAAATIENARFNPPSTNGIDDIDCDDFANGTVRVRLFAFDDQGSEPNFCEVVVEVQDNAGYCDDSDGDLAGSIGTDDNRMLEGVRVDLTGGANSNNTMTDDNGNFRFTGLEQGADYTVQPTFDAAVNLRNVKTSDLTYIIGNILGTSTFDSPYDYVAADVTGDRFLNIFDVIKISQVILGIEAGFDGGNWVFVDADHSIAMDNPYANAFPEVYNVNNLEGNLRNVSFVGVELGNPFHGGGRSAQVLDVENVELKAGQTHTIVLDGSALAGFQGTVELAAGLELVNAEYTGEGGMNLNRAGEGMIAIAVRDEATVTIEVRATTAATLSDMVSFTDAITIREGVTMDGASNTLDLNFTDAVVAGLENSLEQNTPNPVAEVTTIAYNLAVAGPATLTIQDVSGRTIMIRKMEGTAGRNTTTINAADLAASGVLTYTLTAGDFTASRKMVVVK